MKALSQYSTHLSICVFSNYNIHKLYMQKLRLKEGIGLKQSTYFLLDAPFGVLDPELAIMFNAMGSLIS